MVNGLDESGHALKRCLPFSDEAYGNGKNIPLLFLFLYFLAENRICSEKSQDQETGLRHTKIGE